MTEARERAIGAAALAAALAVGSGGATAETVTTTTYSSTSTAGDIAESCKELDGYVPPGSDVGIKARCNLLYEGEVLLSVTARDISSEVYCKPDDSGVLSLAWGAGADKGGYLRNPDVVLDSTGDDYLLEADCEAWGTNTSTDDATIDLGDTTSGYKNASGALNKR